MSLLAFLIMGWIPSDSTAQEDFFESHQLTLGLELYDVIDIAFDGGLIYVLDRSEHSVIIFDEKGKLIKQIGRLGDGPGELRKPMAMALTTDSIFVSDAAYRVTRFRKDDGTYQSRTQWPNAVLDLLWLPNETFVAAFRLPDRENPTMLARFDARFQRMDGFYRFVKPDHWRVNDNDLFRYPLVAVAGERIFALDRQFYLLTSFDLEGKNPTAFAVRPAPPYVAPEDPQPYIEKHGIKGLKRWWATYDRPAGLAIAQGRYLWVGFQRWLPTQQYFAYSADFYDLTDQRKPANQISLDEMFIKGNDKGVWFLHEGEGYHDRPSLRRLTIPDGVFR